MQTNNQNMKAYSNKYRVIFNFFLFFIATLFISSCKKFLDAKTNKALVLSETLDDAQALLDHYSLMNTFFPSLGNESDDNYYLPLSYFQTMAVNNRNRHTWAKSALDETSWGFLYQKVLAANIAKETVDKQPEDIRNTQEAKALKGGALYFRATAFYELCQYYTVPYEKSTVAQSLGIPLRLNSAVDPVSTRTTLEESWQQIVKDYKQAILLLPDRNGPLSRPSKAAAYAALTRVCLSMQDYEMAGKYADSALLLHSTLMSFSDIDASAPYPFKRFNPEVIFSSITSSSGAFLPTRYTIDSLLYQSYNNNDLRKELYFTPNTTGVGTFGFRGGYDGSTTPFNGLATDEIILIRAECAARSGLTDSAMSDMNRLLVTRWKPGTFVPFTATSSKEALNIVLQERRKELILRGTRWFDLRRLNTEEGYAETLIRNVDGVTYTLPSRDPRYTFLIPAKVIALTGMEQNAR